ncbi:MAG TPA: hypothetical protein VFG10_05895 [Saprospiraceae bacterium]|nr:hypothetical protein [Saprospiraceae bacterium]
MTPLRIKILNPKALSLIKGMEELNLIAVEKDPVSKFQEYLKSMRKKSATAPSLKEIGEIVEQVRSQRYAAK